MQESFDLVAHDREGARVRQKIIQSFEDERELGRQMDRLMSEAPDEARRRVIFEDFARRIDEVRTRRKDLERAKRGSESQ